MKFTPGKISGSFIIDLDKREDERGFFARAFCVNEFEEQGLVSKFVQSNMSTNYKKGTIRGLHYQKAPHEEVKVFRCIKGKVFDVVVDLRKDSPTYKQWMGVELSDENHLMLYVPAGCANGYQALEDGAEMLYMVSEFYTPGAEAGIRWNDPVFGIEWPIMDEVIVSEKDQNQIDYKD